MDQSIISIIAIFIIVIWVISMFSGKDTKAAKKAVSATLSTSALKMQMNLEKSAVTENLEWADDILEEFGYNPDEAVNVSKSIQKSLLEPVTATKANRGAK